MISVAGPIAAGSHLRGQHRPDRLRLCAPRNAPLSYYQKLPRRRRRHPSPLRTAPGDLNDANAMTIDANYNAGSVLFSVTCRNWASVSTAPAARWDAGDYLEAPADPEATLMVFSSGVRDLPSQMASNSTGDLTSLPRPSSGAQFCFACGTTERHHHQVGIGEGNWKGLLETTTSGGCLRRTTRSAVRPGRSLHPKPAGVPGGRAGIVISPNLAGRDAAWRWPGATSCSRCRRSWPLPASASRPPSTPPRCQPCSDGQPADGDPLQLDPETERRDDLEWARPSSTSRSPWAGSVHPDISVGGLDYLGQARTGDAYTRPALRMRPTRSDLDDVTGPADYDLYRAIAQAWKP